MDKITHHYTNTHIKHTSNTNLQKHHFYPKIFLIFSPICQIFNFSIISLPAPALAQRTALPSLTHTLPSLPLPSPPSHTSPTHVVDGVDVCSSIQQGEGGGRVTILTRAYQGRIPILHTHTYTHTYIQTYIHTYIYTCFFICPHVIYFLFIQKKISAPTHMHTHTAVTHLRPHVEVA